MRAVIIGAVLIACATCDPAAQFRQTPREFAVRLAANEVPAGVVTPESDFSAKGQSPRRDPRGTQAFRAELPKILAEFKKNNPEFSGKVEAGSVRIASADQPAAVAELLSRRFTTAQDIHVAAGDAIFRHLMGVVQNAPVGGIAGSGPAPGPSCPLQDPVHLPRGARTVEQFLDEVVSQRPGLVWVITYDPGQPDYALKVGVVCPDGVSLRMRVNQ